MKEIVEIIKELFGNFSKKEYYVIIWTVLLDIMVWFVLPEANHGVKLLNLSIDFIVKIVLIIVITIVGVALFICRRILKKNKTKKIGLGIYISSSVIKPADVNKNLFFETFISKLKNSFEIIIYEKKDLEKLISKYDMGEVMKKLNLSCIIEVSERNGNKNNKEIYNLKILKSFLSVITNLSSSRNVEFRNYITQSINYGLDISYDNSLSDVEKETSNLEIIIKFVYAIISSVNNNPSISLELLDDISLSMKSVNRSLDYFKYIDGCLKILYFYDYCILLHEVISSPHYYKVPGNFDTANDYLNKMEAVLRNNNISNAKIKPQAFKDFNQVILANRAIILYDMGQISDALDTICKCDVTLNNVAFSKAFLLASSFQYNKSYERYKNIFRRKNYNEDEIRNILDFINERLDDFEDSIPLKFCFGIINYYFKDKNIGRRYLGELSRKNETIKEIYLSIQKESNQ